MQQSETHKISDPVDTDHILNMVKEGQYSVEIAARLLGWTVEKVKLTVWGEEKDAQ